MTRGLVAIVVGVLVLLGTGLASAERRLDKARAAEARVERVDMGITLHVVRKAPLDGTEIIAGLPRMTLLETKRLGGMVEIHNGAARLTGPSRNPAIWYASEHQAPLILHGADLSPWLLIEGSEGSGKTTAGAMWLAVQALADIGTNAETGITAPTGDRLGHIRKAIKDTWPAHWYRYHKADDLFTWHAGPRFQCVTAAERSKEAGSKIQGFTWVRALSDELQDHFDTEANIESRLRDPRAKGRDKRLCTSTMKDYPDWRTFREKCRAAKPVAGESVPQWGVRRLLGLDSPFIFDRKWQALRAAGTMTEREWRRRILAEDVGPERQVYFNWRRSHVSGRPASLAPLPEGARDVTAQVLAPWATNAGVLVGHDPGTRQHVSLFLKAYLLPGQRRDDERPRWFVVDELTTPESTVHAHAQQVLARLRDKWGCYGVDWRGKPDPSAPCALVRIDPHTRGEGDAHPGSDVATVWRGLGMTARAAAYHASATTVSPATIKRRQRIDMINTLLAATDAVGEVRRLFVQLIDDKPAAPMLVKALESMEFNAAGQAETEKKDADDLSHWPAALGYALWQIEAPRLKLEHAA